MTPTGWTLRDGLWMSAGVATDPHAIERKGGVSFNPFTLETKVTPWVDGSQCDLTFTQPLPLGTIVGTPTELEYGWTYPCNGSVLTRIDVVDLQLTNQLSYLRTFGAEGLKVIWWMNVSAIKDDGGDFWRPKRSIVYSVVPFDVFHQGEITPEYEDGQLVHFRPKFAEHSLAYYGTEEKLNNRCFPTGGIDKAYHTGKMWHSPRPTALFWSANGTLLGVVYGRLEWDAENSCEVKAYPLAECMAYVNGGATQVSIDATLGYTTAGASSGAARNRYIDIATVASNTTVNNINSYLSSAGSNAQLCLTDSTPDNPVLANSRSGLKAISSAAWISHTYSGTLPALVASKTNGIICMSENTSLFYNYYDTGTGSRSSFVKNQVIYPVNDGDLLYINSWIESTTAKWSDYITYGESGGGGGKPYYYFQ